jgi:hypothetical protein
VRAGHRVRRREPLVDAHDQDEPHRDGERDDEERPAGAGRGQGWLLHAAM